MVKKDNKKILKKTTYNPINKISAVKAVQGMAMAQGQVVKEVEKPELKEDKRSLFFKEAFNKEINTEKKWLS